ncbi:response regulator transcription factor [Georgenia sp. Z1344]|uniref:response regulator transcription factor n=1 Tax=Georgenia sp. Z1344 TaxID=3416706 RepID=UPI003CF74C42
MAQILIIEDEVGIASFVTKGLTAAGHQSTAVTTGKEGLDHARTSGYDLVVLDVGLPDIDGFQVLQTLRGEGHTLPVIMLTARSSVDDTVTGLDSGADDYMPKPFRFEELLARVRLRLRSAQQTSSGADPTQLQVADLSLDVRTRQATVAGRTVDLSAREFSLLETFILHPGQVLSREQILSRVWGYDFDPGSNVVDVYVRYLRKKIGAERIQTVPRMGYRLVTG